MIIYIAGGSWDGVPGTDFNLATALAEDVSVLWVEPPVPITALVRSRSAPQPHIQKVREKLHSAYFNGAARRHAPGSALNYCSGAEFRD